MTSSLRHAHLVLVFAVLATSTTSADWTPAAAILPIVRHDVALRREDSVVEGRIPRNATLAGVLASNHISTTMAQAIVTAFARVFDVRHLRVDDVFRVRRSADGAVSAFECDVDAARYVRVAVGESDATGRLPVEAAIVAYPTETTEQSVSADITRAQSSLVAALDAAGENVDLALSLAQIFGGEVDFNSDLHNGDRIQAMYERVTRDGRPIGYGRVEGAVITNAGRRLVAIPFAASDGTPGWYDEQGRSLKRQFLKSPLPFEPRITSGFSLSRVHPIYGDVRAHLGVDYGAPAGTSVVAVASGTVESAGWAGDAGRMVVLRHAGGYETLYLHLSSFAAGLSAGAHVAQGELIGRVGSSGAATGPHLDFRIRKNGSYVNPVAEVSRMPHADPMPASSMPAFEVARDRVLQELSAQPLSPKH